MIHGPIFDPKADSPLSDEDLKRKRDRYSHFKSQSVISRIAKNSLGADISRVEPLGAGANAFDHLVFRVYTDKGLRVVFRLNTDPLVAEHFLVEAELYRVWHRAGIPSPEVYDVILRTKKSDPDYILLENVGTHDIEEYLRTYPQDATLYAESSGQFLRNIHAVPMEGFGTLVLRSGVLRGIQTTWKEAICTRLEETVTYLVEHQLLTVKEGRDVSDAFGRHERLLDIEDGVILHGDYHNANIMIDEIGRKVVAAIDLSQAKSGDPIFDLAFYGTYVSDEIFDSFCGGYFGCSRRPSDFDKKLALYQLRIYLSKAKLRKRFGYNERIGSAIKGVLESLKKLT